MRLLIISVLLMYFTSLHSQVTYFLSSNEGNDSNSGTSPNSSWKTLNKFTPGNTYLFKTGDTFYLKIGALSNPSNQPIFLDSYGTGPRPLISLYKIILPIGWSVFSNDIWRVDLKNPDNLKGFIDTTDTNVGFIKVDGQIKGEKKESIDLLKNNFDFYSDKQYLFFYLTQKPSEVYSKVEAACNYHIIQLSDDMQISNLSLTGSGGHAIQGGSVQNIKINNVEISEIGGSYLPGFKRGTTRYGNGIELGNGSKSCQIINCSVNNVYDAAFTMQGAGSGLFENVKFENNYCNNNEQSFEFWVKDYKSGFKNCYFENNICENAGLGWSHNVRPDKNVGVHVLIYYWQVNSSDLSIKSNIFRNAKCGYMYLHDYISKIPLFKSYQNTVYLSKDLPVTILSSGNEVRSDSSFLRTAGLESTSKFIIK